MRHIHIIGIAGTFMGGLARLALALGYKVTGCDDNIYPPMSTQLKELGIEVIKGFGTEQIHLNPDVYIIGNITKRGMPIIETILNQNKPYISGPQWLYENILHKYHVLAVAGTHGKTTTASMLAWILEFAELHPSLLIGGIPENFQVSSKLSQNSPYFVLEADEYDTAFFDKRSKFVHYHPRTLIINNLEYDHADIFANLASIQKQFHHLIRMIPNEGLVIYKDSEKNIQQVFEMGIWTPTIAFAGKNGFYAKNINNNDSNFEIFFQKKYQGTINWLLFGIHNQNNALAAIAAAYHIGIPIKTSCEALCHFKNVKKRMELKGTIKNITVYDDFAHHPTSIKTTIESLRNQIGPSKRILAVFEPRSNTMKLGTIKKELANSLKEADLIFCYSGNIDWDIKYSLNPLKEKTIIKKNLDVLITKIIESAQPTDYILIMSNGSFNGIHDTILKRLEEK